MNTDAHVTPQAADMVDGLFGGTAPDGAPILGSSNPTGNNTSGGTVHGAAALSSVAACAGRRSRVDPVRVS